MYKEIVKEAIEGDFGGYDEFDAEMLQDVVVDWLETNIKKQKNELSKIAKNMGIKGASLKKVTGTGGSGSGKSGMKTTLTFKTPDGDKNIEVLIKLK